MKTFPRLFIAACIAALATSASAAEGKTFRAGAAQVDITPTTFPVINSGGFLERQSKL